MWSSLITDYRFYWGAINQIYNWFGNYARAEECQTEESEMMEAYMWYKYTNDGIFIF